MRGGAAKDSGRSSELFESCLHFRPGVLVADLLCHGDAGSQDLLGFVSARQPDQKLAVVKIARTAYYIRLAGATPILPE